MSVICSNEGLQRFHLDDLAHRKLCATCDWFIQICLNQSNANPRSERPTSSALFKADYPENYTLFSGTSSIRQIKIPPGVSLRQTKQCLREGVQKGLTSIVL